MDSLGLWTTGLSGYLSFSPFVPFGSTLASFEGPRQDRSVNLRCSQFGGCVRATRSRQQVRVTRQETSQTAAAPGRRPRRNGDQRQGGERRQEAAREIAAREGAKRCSRNPLEMRRTGSHVLWQDSNLARVVARTSSAATYLEIST